MKPIKLNLGCGNKKLNDYINCDILEGCKPDLVINLEEGKFSIKERNEKLRKIYLEAIK